MNRLRVIQLQYDLTPVAGLALVGHYLKMLAPESMVGKRSDKIKATDVIWEFFQKHQKT